MQMALAMKDNGRKTNSDLEKHCTDLTGMDFTPLISPTKAWKRDRAVARWCQIPRRVFGPSLRKFTDETLSIAVVQLIYFLTASQEGRKNGHGSFSWADRSSYEVGEPKGFLMVATSGIDSHSQL